MTTLGPDHFGHNIRMVIKTEASITAPESTPTGAEFVILLGMRKLYDVKIKTLPFDYL